MLNSSFTNGFVINTNMASLMVQRNLANVTNDMAAYMEHLSTNYKVNRASDDPAGLALSMNYERQINSLGVAKSNSQTGISLLQTAENDLTTIKDNLSTMQDLIIQAQTGTTTDPERAAMNSIFQQLLSEIQRISSTSEYSGIQLMDGTRSGAGSVVLQIDINNNANHKLDISSALANSQTAALGINGTAVDTIAHAAAAQSLIDTAYDTINQRTSLVGAFITRLNTNVQRIESKSENLQAANSLIRDTDVAAETAKLTRAQILQQTSVALLQQANQSSALIFTLIGAT